MTRDELAALMTRHDLTDVGLLFHAFRNYGRDYELIVSRTADVPSSPHGGVFSFVFRNCVFAATESSLRSELWQQSLDDRLTSFEAYTRCWDEGEQLEGFVWGAGIDLYPGWTLVTPSERADAWCKSLGIDFHEVRIEANAIVISLVFTDLAVAKLADQAEVLGTDLPDWADRFWTPASSG